MLNEFYNNKLRSLKVDRSSGHPKPHKVCLLLSIIDLIESGDISENKIINSDSLKKSFNFYFERLKKGNDAANLHLPFYHLKSDGFWHFKVQKDKQSKYQALVSSNSTPSMSRLFDVIEFAYLDSELFDFFSNSLARVQAREALLDNLEDLSVQFHRWLLSMGKSERTANSYVGAIRGKISDWLADAEISERNLISMAGYSTVNSIMESLSSYAPYQKQDSRGNNMYSAALNSYKRFLSVTCQIDIKEDIESIIKDKAITTTEKSRLVNARVGQGKFRENVIEYWKTCALTGYPSSQFLIASHIKPWRSSNNDERLDKYNGLLLLANLDKAFDLGYITFEESGNIRISKFVEKPDVLGICEDMSIQLDDQHQEYMRYHRKEAFEHF